MFCLCKDSTDGSGVMGRVGLWGYDVFLAVERSSIFSSL